MRLPAVLCAAPVLAAVLLAADAPRPAYDADVKPASEEALRVMAKFKLPAGLKADLWAAEPMLANPVALSLDEQGRCYVAETFRHSRGVPDIRGHMAWLDDDLACRTVADRLAVYRKHLGANFDSYALHHDRVRLIADSDGDGKADKATVFADGFNTHVSGIGAGVLARHGKVWYTCIPDLWLLQDTKGTGTADVRRSLSTGYGVHTGFIGHDLHGLRLGPDGKLYFSVGDRGANVTTADGRTLFNPDSGAVFRCNLDGTDLELFATGLRNPQELAFNEFGDLFTCDNNSDGGDKARWVHVVEGGDSGWRIGYQFINEPVARGPWNAEKLWHPAPANSGPSQLPPLFNLTDGPSGMCYDPGTGLPDAFRGRFFLCDFRGGTSGTSGVRAVKLKPKGATYELDETKEFFWSVLATDCDFGPDGNLYVSDWSEGWSMPGKGRIYRVGDPKFQGTDMQKQVRSLLAEPMDRRPVAELTRLLAHADQRVRQEAQLALAAQGKSAVPALAAAAGDGSNRLARLHAIWALGQVGRTDDSARAPLANLLKDADSEVRAQAARVVGWCRWPLIAELTALLKDSEPRVRFQAATALGRMRKDGAWTEKEFTDVIVPVRMMLDSDADRDPYLRHAGVLALSALGPAVEVAALDPSPAMRLAAVLALRRLGEPAVARFLDDADPRIVLEAARAIHDAELSGAESRLAALITRPSLPDPLGRRVLVANFRQGTPVHAAALAKFATRSDVSEALRVEALELLGQWAKPSGRDRLTGLWRPLTPRPAADAAAALKPLLTELLRGPDLVRVEAAVLCGMLGVGDAAPLLQGMFADRQRLPKARVEALKALTELKAPQWAETVERAVTDPEPQVRVAALGLVARLDPAQSLKLLEGVLERGTAGERQAALATLGGMRGREADTILGRMLDRLAAGQVPPEVQLDVLLAAEKRRSGSLREKLNQYEAARPKGDDLAAWRETLAGGHADGGKKVFFEKQEVSCQRCHKVGGQGGEVGPDLSDVGARLNREAVLESIVLPNKQIAKNFETAVVTMANGKTYAGVVRADDAKELVIMTAEGATLHLPKDQIEQRDRGDSAMPADVMKYLTKSELRDLVEFLAGQKTAPK